MNDHDGFQDMAAAHVLGALEPRDRAAFERHLGACERCRREVLDLAPIPALLSRLDRHEVDEIGHAVPADGAVDAIRQEVDRTSRSRRRWRALAVAGVVAAVAATGLALTDRPPARTFDGTPLEVAASSAADEADVLAAERAWGTYVWVSARGLPPRDGYVLWVIDDDGSWHQAGTFARTPEGRADLGGSTQHRLEDIRRIVVTSTDRTDEILTAS